MPVIRTPDSTARRLLFGVPLARLTKAAGWGSRNTAYSRKMNPNTITIQELAILAKENKLTDEEIVTVVKQYQ